MVAHWTAAQTGLLLFRSQVTFTLLGNKKMLYFFEVLTDLIGCKGGRVVGRMVIIASQKWVNICKPNTLH